MVDELEMLKKDWQKQEGNLPKYTKEELYPMLLKKSSSVVKWILFISIIEFSFWIVLNFVLDHRDANIAFEEKAGINTIDKILLIVNYIALAYFVICFYLNYRSIKATDSAKELMKNILKARGTVKLYIWFNVSFIFIGSLLVFGVAYYNDPETFNIASPLVLIVVLFLLLGLFIGVLLLIYRLIYGRLTKRLKANYDQLKKLEL